MYCSIVHGICVDPSLHSQPLPARSNFVPPDGIPNPSSVGSFFHLFVSEQMYRRYTCRSTHHRCGIIERTLHKRSSDDGWEPTSKPVMDTSNVGLQVRHFLMHRGSASLILERYLNDTWVYNTSSPYCPKDQTRRWCDTYRGGLYDPDQSSNSRKVPDVFAAGASPSDVDRTEGLHVWDSTWILDDLGVSNTTLVQYPIGMPGFDYGTQNHPTGSIGLGPNSTLLTALKDAGTISSRSYGYWWGENGATSDAQMDGSLVLGGYDAAKIQGSNITTALRTPSLSCMSGMHMTISDIVMRFPNGTRSSIIVSSLPLTLPHSASRH